MVVVVVVVVAVVVAVVVVVVVVVVVQSRIEELLSTDGYPAVSINRSNKVALLSHAVSPQAEGLLLASEVWQNDRLRNDVRQGNRPRPFLDT